MTNAQIIFNESIKLLEDGKIHGTGRIIRLQHLDDDGNTVERTIEEPQEIHTFSTWKTLGRKIKRGQHAVAQFPIWKYTTRQTGTATNTETGEVEPVEDSRCFMKVSHFFTIEQTEPITQ